jgi:hypothetical protein
MKKILLALTAVAALGATQTTFAQAIGAKELAEIQTQIAAVQADKRQVMLDTLALNPQQLAKFTPIYDEYQLEMNKIMTRATNLNNRLFVIDFAGMTDPESKAILKDAFALRKDRLELLQKYADKLEKELSSTKVFQFVQIENKMQVLIDLAVSASVPIVTKTPNTQQ